MSWMDHPASFQISFRQLSPRKIAVSTQQTAKEFRVMPGMEHDQSHTFQHALLNAVDQSVTHLLMGNMPPPEEYVCVIENILAETFIRIVKAATAYGETFVL